MCSHRAIRPTSCVSVVFYLANISGLVKGLLVHGFQRFNHTGQIHQLAGQRDAVYSYNAVTTIGYK